MSYTIQANEEQLEKIKNNFCPYCLERVGFNWSKAKHTPHDMLAECPLCHGEFLEVYEFSHILLDNNRLISELDQFKLTQRIYDTLFYNGNNPQFPLGEIDEQEVSGETIAIKLKNGDMFEITVTEIQRW